MMSAAVLVEIGQVKAVRSLKGAGVSPARSVTSGSFNLIAPSDPDLAPGFRHQRVDKAITVEVHHGATRPGGNPHLPRHKRLGIRVKGVGLPRQSLSNRTRRMISMLLPPFRRQRHAHVRCFCVAWWTSKGSRTSSPSQGSMKLPERRQGGALGIPPAAAPTRLARPGHARHQRRAAPSASALKPAPPRRHTQHRRR